MLRTVEVLNHVVEEVVMGKRLEDDDSVLFEMESCCVTEENDKVLEPLGTAEALGVDC